jgi:hypothetical protein
LVREGLGCSFRHAGITRPGSRAQYKIPAMLIPVPPFVAKFPWLDSAAVPYTLLRSAGAGLKNPCGRLQTISSRSEARQPVSASSGPVHEQV